MIVICLWNRSKLTNVQAIVLWFGHFLSNSPTDHQRAFSIVWTIGRMTVVDAADLLWIPLAPAILKRFSTPQLHPRPHPRLNHRLWWSTRVRWISTPLNPSRNPGKTMSSWLPGQRTGVHAKPVWIPHPRHPFPSPHSHSVLSPRTTISLLLAIWNRIPMVSSHTTKHPDDHVKLPPSPF